MMETFLLSFTVVIGALSFFVWKRKQKLKRSTKKSVPAEANTTTTSSTWRERTTSGWKKTIKGVGKIPLIPLLTLVVAGWVLVPPALGLYNWLSQPTTKMKVVEFRSTTFAKSNGDHQTISVGPLEKWQLDTGVLFGAGQHPNGHFICPSIPPVLLVGRVFEERDLGGRRAEYSFTPAARQKLAGAGVTSVLVTFTRMIGKPGHLSPCDQIL